MLPSFHEGGMGTTGTSGKFKNMRRPEYREAMHQVFLDYMASHDWKRVRTEVRDHANGKCAKCGQFVGDAGIAHHKHYRHWGKANFEEIASCVYLCRKCHRHVAHDHTPFFAQQSFDPCVVDEDDIRRAIESLCEDSK